MERQPRRYVYAFDDAPASPDADLRTILGGKGANLVVMARDLGLPVPPGFTITTEACRRYLRDGWPDGLEAELRDHLDRLGRRIGRRFGDATDPLLVSVRSGAPVSMPGMMDTILNVGLTDSTVGGLARASGSDVFANDCLRRLREGYSGVVGSGVLPDEPWVQLRQAVEAVFRSWESGRARAYRRREAIPDDLGTAVTVQTMVFGNRGRDSGTGVVFTRDPSSGEPVLYGDVLFDAQGEDVVAGTHSPERIAVLDERLPEAAGELRRYAAVLEHHYADMCDIEFTIERGRLWILQVRVGKRSPRAALRIATDMAEDPAFPLDRAAAVRRVAGSLADPPRVFIPGPGAAPPIATGLPASPGVASGSIVTSSEAALAAADAGESVILVRSETSPEDVPGMARAAGVLTARGGLASHAAVVARGWGIPAVVGAEAVRPSGDSVVIDGHVLRPGERITIDGATGGIHLGELPGSSQVAPEAARLLGWARDLGIPIGGSSDDDDASQRHGAPSREVAPVEAIEERDVMRALLVTGGASLDHLAELTLAEPDVVAPLVERLLETRLAERTGDRIRLGPAGKVEASGVFDADREAVGERRCVATLESFHAFDARMKDLVTAWQVRDLAGEQVINDHSDEAYDARVIDDLAGLHEELAAWLSPLEGDLRPLAVYRSRLDRAMERVRAGDGRFVASPRVDSYHGVWFELHEHLIRLAGRQRADEAAAGRA